MSRRSDTIVHLEPTEPRRLVRPRRRRALLRGLSLLLVAYGAAGIVILVVAVMGISQPLEEVVDLGESLEQQRAGLLDSLDTTAETLEDAAAGVDGMDDSLAQARTATDRAATIANDVSFTMSQMAIAMDVQILGSRPFQQLAGGFDQAAGQLGALSGDLGAIGTALGRNGDDARVVGEDLRSLRDTIDELATLVDAGPRLEASSEALEMVRIVLYGVLLWLLTLAAALIVLGLALWRRASTG